MRSAKPWADSTPVLIFNLFFCQSDISALGERSHPAEEVFNSRPPVSGVIFDFNRASELQPG